MPTISSDIFFFSAGFDGLWLGFWCKECHYSCPLQWLCLTALEGSGKSCFPSCSAARCSPASAEKVLPPHRQPHSEESYQEKRKERNASRLFRLQLNSSMTWLLEEQKCYFTCRSFIHSFISFVMSPTHQARLTWKEGSCSTQTHSWKVNVVHTNPAKSEKVLNRDAQSVRVYGTFHI